jgi:glutathione peroxidase
MNCLRRSFLSLLGSGFLITPAFVRAQEVSRPTAYAFTFKGLETGDIRLADYVGKPILVVNTASLCGYTPQYTGLQELWTRYHPRGLMIIGVPSNDYFQEPGGAADIMKTAHSYNVSFPIADKVSIKGTSAHPFYKWAALEKPLDRPRWNFHKYLIGRDGHVVAVFATLVEPTDARVIAAIEKELAKTS